MNIRKGHNQMSLTRKPKPAPAPDEATVQQLINKGGSVAAPAAAPDNEQLVSVLLRIPAHMLARIDGSVKQRLPVRISRQAWIIEALQEKLGREGDAI
jgi:hypothetical protein